MFNISVLGSSSKGNCIYVDAGSVSFLLDAGLSMRDTKKKLREIGVKLSNVDYLIISHSHGDHTKGVKLMTETYGFTSVCSKPTSLSLDISPTYIRFIDGGKTLQLDGIEITAFDVPHDAYGTLAFSIKNELGEKLLYLTDCGSPEGIEFEDHDVFIIEANYDNSKLMENLDSGRLHFAVGRRTASGTGHLEINETIEILKNSAGERTKQIVLSHLSDINSDGELFIKRIKDELGFENVSIAKYGLNINFGENQDFL